MACHGVFGVVFTHRLFKTIGIPKMTPIRAELHRSMPRPRGRARRTAVAAAVATALGVFPAPDAMSQTASQSDVQRLQQEIEKQQREIDRQRLELDRMK